MDIDEFLDRELSELGLPAENKAAETGIEFTEIKEDSELAALFENIKSHLRKGNVDSAEQLYVRLWNILIEQRLKWNKDLYEQLLELSRQFSTVLKSAYDEVKSKEDRVYELIEKARAAIKDGKKYQAFKIYSEVEEVNNSIPNAFFEEKKVVQEHITVFYEELRNTTDNELIKRVTALIQEINRLIDKINIAIRAKDMTNAISNYNKCIELYNQVPEGFLMYKNSAGMRILEIYKALGIYTEIFNLQRQLMQHPGYIKQQASLLKIFPNINKRDVADLSKSALLKEKRERAKKNIEEGLYDEAIKEIEEVLKAEPKDVEAKALHAKIKTLQ